VRNGLSLQERKKIGTRRALTDAATRLFLARGYDAVTVAEIAEEARTAVTTLFTYFPGGKEALVFGGEDRVAAFTAAIAGRPAGCRVLDAVEAFISDRAVFGPAHGETRADLERLVVETPALCAHARKQWVACEPVLSDALAAEAGRPVDVSTRALARFALEVPGIVAQVRGSRDAVAAIFTHLRTGWMPAPR
jgi:AcrR family transcriptional regulator